MGSVAHCDLCQYDLCPCCDGWELKYDLVATLRMTDHAAKDELKALLEPLCTEEEDLPKKMESLEVCSSLHLRKGLRAALMSHFIQQ